MEEEAVQEVKIVQLAVGIGLFVAHRRELANGMVVHRSLHKSLIVSWSCFCSSE